MENKRKSGLLGTPVGPERTTIKGTPPLVFAVQPDSYFEIHTPEELDAWEEDVKTAIGGGEKKAGMASELKARARYGYSCSCGQIDDCCQC